MKKFIYVLMWIQLAYAIFLGIFHPDWPFSERLPSTAVSTDINVNFVAFWVLYIAWRVTPDSKPPEA